jgi:hypothetical protein
MREESLRSSKEQPIKEIIAKFLKAHSLASKLDNPSWKEAT